ncbi:MAG: hypothetical protein JJU19_08005 [Pararhodobacter sp.]|nr:hypothetical protein [Pararhodobacter sp.]
MGIDEESYIAANLQIGPTTLGMVRIYIEADGLELPLDFEPAEAEEIAEEILGAARAARAAGGGNKKGSVPGGAGRKPRR